jgi:hypothetical protein
MTVTVVEGGECTCLCFIIVYPTLAPVPQEKEPNALATMLEVFEYAQCVLKVCLMGVGCCCGQY